MSFQYGAYLSQLPVSVTFSGRSDLNLSYDDFSKDMLEQEESTPSANYIETPAGGVAGLMAAVIVPIKLSLNKLSTAVPIWRATVTANSFLGNITCYFDTPNQPPLTLFNVTVLALPAFKANAEDANFVVNLKGSLAVNQRS